MSQLAYANNMTQAIEGMLADSGPKRTVSRVSATAMPRARCVVIDTTATLNGRGVKLPDADFSASQGLVEGVLMWDPSRVVDPVTENNFIAGVELPVLRQGVIWVRPEDAVTRGGQAFARFTGGTGTEAVGRFRSNADTATAAAVPSARFMDTTGGIDLLSRLEINLPATA